PVGLVNVCSLVSRSTTWLSTSQATKIKRSRPITPWRSYWNCRLVKLREARHIALQHAAGCSGRRLWFANREHHSQSTRRHIQYHLGRRPIHILGAVLPNGLGSAGRGTRGARLPIGPTNELDCFKQSRSLGARR